MQTTYLYLNTIALIIVILLGVLSYKNREERYAKAFMYSMIFMGIWTISSGVELLTKSFFLKVVARDFTQFGMAFVAVSSYAFVIYYASFEKRMYRWLLKTFLVLHILNMILLFSDSIHHLLREKVEMVLVNGVPELQITPTVFGTACVVFRFVVFAFGMILLFVFLIKTFKNMRKQVIMILTGFVLAFVLLILKQFLFENIGVHFPMSVILIFPYMFIAIGIFRYDFLSVAPFAKEWIINSLEDGIIVLSKEGHMLEVNDAAKRLLKQYKRKLNIEQMAENMNDVEDSFHRVELENDQGITHFNVSIHHLLTSNKKRRGSVVVIKDVTLQRRKQDALRQKVDYDGLTKIYNRQALEREYYMLSKGPLSVFVIDLDHFKKVNDTYGHPVGDVVLNGFVEAMKKSIRRSDLIGRIGGDEFCIVLSECPKELCIMISERIRKMIHDQEYPIDADLKPMTASIGGLSNIEIGAKSFEDAFAKADEALYMAKKKGRDQAVIF